MKKLIFISYDFGMKGDYEGLFKWLDENNAEERGYGIGIIKEYSYDNKSIKTDNEFWEFVRDELKNKVKLGSNDRIYMIWNSLESNKTKAAFLFGRSKQSPWAGYAQNNLLQNLDLDV
ncbi:hypothetical protein [Dyadobacter bucti]|uniref:hypothetical protein n=1 Tax=Dyadobacter bucti TaxID=2572203 RepID=UPI001109357C|nr:hypothetical protein [Dyadobacter bucti]